MKSITLKGVFLVLAILVAALGVLWFLGWGVSYKTFAQQSETIKLPLLMIAGVVVLLLCLSMVSVVFAALNLSDKSQALGVCSA